ncbi:NAD(P)H-binding protein [Chryseolinea sp. T2]|uniref:NAD(P)H-binding protein n=1 Tax=Chryseolinea sp. T2 TaxID=3129255 RepID=UPI0030777768
MVNRTISILGCGWLGKQLGASLVNEGYTVLGSTTKVENVDGLKSTGIIPFVFSAGNVPDEARAFFHADVLIISLPQRIRAQKGEEYVMQVSDVVSAARSGNVGKIILFSTTSVYPDLNRVVTEDDADAVHSVVRAERIVQLSGIESTIVRFAGLFGPGREPGRFLAAKKDVPGAMAPVNLIHADDCIGIVKRIIEGNAWGHVLNACADEHPTRKDFYTKAAIALGMEPPVFSDTTGDYKIVSNAHLKTVLNYRMTHRLN